MKVVMQSGMWVALDAEVVYLTRIITLLALIVRVSGNDLEVVGPLAQLVRAVDS